MMITALLVWALALAFVADSCNGAAYTTVTESPDAVETSPVARPPPPAPADHADFGGSYIVVTFEDKIDRSTACIYYTVGTCYDISKGTNGGIAASKKYIMKNGKVFRKLYATQGCRADSAYEESEVEPWDKSVSQLGWVAPWAQWNYMQRLLKVAPTKCRPTKIDNDPCDFSHHRKGHNGPDFKYCK